MIAVNSSGKQVEDREGQNGNTRPRAPPSKLLGALSPLTTGEHDCAQKHTFSDEDHANSAARDRTLGVLSL